mgnify:CR=1 FL=1
MRNKFDMQLERLNSQLTHMGEMCEIAITRATKALEDGKVDEAKAVQEADEEIDQLEKDNLHESADALKKVLTDMGIN